MGRPRKEEGLRVRRNLIKPGGESTPKQAGITLPPWDGVRRGPTLHSISMTTPNGNDWHPATHAWWNCWRDSSQAVFMVATDWRSLHIAAILHDRINRGVSDTALGQLAAQLQKREGAIGAQIEDRARIGMNDEEKPAATPDLPGIPVPSVDYQKRLEESLAKQKRVNGLV